MFKRLLVFFLVYSLQSACTYGADEVRRALKAERITQPPKIDGIINEACWKVACKVAGFTETRPVAGRSERDDLSTEVYISYDDMAVYVAACMHDVSPDSIHHELSTRDNIGSADMFSVFFDPYNEHQCGFGFFVTPSGVQFDARYSSENNAEDPSWNAVWESATRIEGNNWYAELRIPYSALRFPKKEVQTWAVNFMRTRDVSSQQLFWSKVDPSVNGFMTQWGEMSEIKNIKPPVRLSLSPYISAYIDHYPYNTPGLKNTNTNINGGMDLKYGISQSFTLDMTLIPDFGQVQSDNRILNLTPFEIRYNENRGFFTEGTELFNKGGFFYSRRIGSEPVNYYKPYDEAGANETVIKNPSESKLLNATKVSGRTSGGLGIGVFNAVTRPMYATLESTEGQKREIETQPLTNYNILVFDQSLKNSSSVTLLNTNVIRNGSTYDANLTAAMFSVNDKTNTYNVSGKVATSRQYNLDDRTIEGYHYMVTAGKTSGKFTFTLGQYLWNDKYDPNDLGILFNNNEIDQQLDMSYNIFKPGKWYNRNNTGVGMWYLSRYLPRSFQSFYFYIWNYTQFKNMWSLNLNADLNPVYANDFYEARRPGRVYKELPYNGFGINLSTNYSKKYYVSYFYYVKFKDRFHGWGFDSDLYQNFRFNDHLAVSLETIIGPRYNYAGYATVDETNDDILFARRDRKTIENVLSIKYTFNNSMGIQLRGRHYFSNVNDKQYYTLLEDGELMPNTGYTGNTNINFNLFNVDMVYSWHFAPGSEFNLVWKNSIQDVGQDLINPYFRNLDRTLAADQLNSFSMKLLYYIDYLDVRGKLSRKKA
ncbi:MAG TPA: DUF5916 domain-containing protein [Bacteroidia bacterium]|nr:DUF5916 domain-containing protein [Bacteroidia bacterium]